MMCLHIIKKKKNKLFHSSSKIFLFSDICFLIIFLFTWGCLGQLACTSTNLHGFWSKRPCKPPVVINISNHMTRTSNYREIKSLDLKFLLLDHLLNACLLIYLLCRAGEKFVIINGWPCSQGTIKAPHFDGAFLGKWQAKYFFFFFPKSSSPVLTICKHKSLEIWYPKP